ncbi:hypothetical protein Taro_042993 [Colocasia esculenta]|uniref:Uncharacterized protein n=1 Tax=Colocasia esculenta TaxID=4460 RepID=A0A843X0M1_COLES|nr:hypothetical protein [Colocasia esculenta]
MAWQGLAGSHRREHVAVALVHGRGKHGRGEGGVAQALACSRCRRGVRASAQGHTGECGRCAVDAGSYMVLHFPSLFDASPNSYLRSNRPGY